MVRSRSGQNHPPFTCLFCFFLFYLFIYLLLFLFFFSAGGSSEVFVQSSS